MKVEKKVVDHIEKCYAISEFYYNGERHLLCSAEGNGPCRIYDMEGKWVETIWEGPGGVMTLLQVPNTETPILLATQGFYSPDYAESGKIVYYFKIGEQWKCETLCNLPFVHRFGIVSNGKRNYLVAATLKSANAFAGDWTCPGRVWTAPLPENILEYNCKNPLVLEPLISGLYKNHGFSINREGDTSYVVIGAENGVYTVFPPKTEKGNWRSVICCIETLIGMEKKNYWFFHHFMEIRFGFLRKIEKYMREKRKCLLPMLYGAEQ